MPSYHISRVTVQQLAEKVQRAADEEPQALSMLMGQLIRETNEPEPGGKRWRFMTRVFIHREAIFLNSWNVGA